GHVRLAGRLVGAAPTIQRVTLGHAIGRRVDEAGIGTLAQLLIDGVDDAVAAVGGGNAVAGGGIERADVAGRARAVGWCQHHTGRADAGHARVTDRAHVGVVAGRPVG